jgi:hypothetical protein
MPNEFVHLLVRAVRRVRVVEDEHVLAIEVNDVAAVCAASAGGTGQRQGEKQSQQETTNHDSPPVHGGGTLNIARERQAHVRCAVLRRRPRPPGPVVDPPETDATGATRRHEIQAKRAVVSYAN